MAVVKREHVKFADGGSESFENIFKEHFSKLVVFSSRYIGNRSICEDLVQETFMYLWDVDMVFKSDISLIAFLFKTVRNKSLNYIKHKKIKEKYSEESLRILKSDQYFIDNIMCEEFSELLYKAIGELTPQRKEVIVMHLSGIKNNEIAENLHISVATVKTHKSLAYKELRLGLKKEYELL